MTAAASEQMALAEVKNRLSEVLDRIEREHGRVVITEHGRPAVVVLSVDDMESLEESLEVLSSESPVADISEALAERAHPCPHPEQGRGDRAAEPSVSDFRIDWSGPARRALQRIPHKTATAVVEFVHTGSQRVGKPLTPGLTGLHSSRRGDYCMSSAIDDEQRAIEIVAIGHRSDVYRRT